MDFGLLLIHVVVGTFVAAHGAQKLGGNGPAYMEALGLRRPRLAATLGGTNEVAGGLLLGLGLFTPLAAAMVASTMLVAIGTDHRGKGFWIYNGGFEYALTVAAVAVGLAFNGAGAWSLDNAFGFDLAGTPWGVAALIAAAVGGAAALAVFRRTAPQPVASAA